MRFVPFMEVFPELGNRETRTMRLDGNHGRVPEDTYEMIEFFCADPKCDCRRVLLQVFAVSNAKPACTISFAFDRDAPMRGPYVDPLNPRGKFADEMLELVEQVVLSDPQYVRRLERHYTMFKNKLGGHKPFDHRSLTPDQVAERIAERKRRRKALKRALSLKAVRPPR